MKIETDKETDVADIYLKDEIKEKEVAKTKSINENIILDFDSNNRILGIEVLNASKNLPIAEKLVA